MWTKGKLTAFLLMFQVLFVILFAVFVEYDDDANASKKANSLDKDKGGADPDANPLKHYYPMFQDVHTMMFIGFGFLMTFLKRYGYSSVGFNLLLSAFVIQWATLMEGFLHLHDGSIIVNIVSMLTADFAVAAVLISMGACLGKLGPLQLMIMGFLEIVVFQVNEWIGLTHYKAVDVGGSMFVHVFGAYFGITVARVLYNEDVEKAEHKEGAVYHSDLFSMIGTIFLWLFWPSFNSALAPADDQHRAVLNTYFALAACTVIAFAFSALVDKNNKIDMVHIQNSTLAGGVAVGTCADFMIHPYGAILIGSLAGIISVAGFKYVTPFLASRLKLHDTCGVNNLHGMPGLLAGICGIVVSALASERVYGLGLYQIFPARAPFENSTELNDIVSQFSVISAGDDRSAGLQAGYQAAALATTLGMAIVGGAITGLVLKIPIWDQPSGEQVFDDTDYWLMPEEEVPGDNDDMGTKADHYSYDIKNKNTKV